MQQLVEHEQLTLMAGFINTFVPKSKRMRYLELLKKQSGISKILDDLAKKPLFDEIVAHRLLGSDRIAGSIGQRLKALRSPDLVRVLSENTKLNGRVGPLDEILRAMLGTGLVTIVICIPEQLALFEGESGRDRFILSAKKS